MSDVKVPYGDDPQETATLLLDAAEKEGDQSVVKTTGSRSFLVPEAVAKAAGVDYEGKKAPAKKAPAKKAPAKKAPAKKATAKKAAKKTASKDKE